MSRALPEHRLIYVGRLRVDAICLLRNVLTSIHIIWRNSGSSGVSRIPFRLLSFSLFSLSLALSHRGSFVERTTFSIIAFPRRFGWKFEADSWKWSNEVKRVEIDRCQDINMFRWFDFGSSSPDLNQLVLKGNRIRVLETLPPSFYRQYLFTLSVNTEKTYTKPRFVIKKKKRKDEANAYEMIGGTTYVERLGTRQKGLDDRLSTIVRRGGIDFQK